MNRGCALLRATGPADTVKMRPTRATVIGACLNAFEWYEYAVFTYLATVIGSLFFPESNQTTQLMWTFGVFAAGFAMRPLGAVLFGHIGDKFGRKKALLLSLWVMALPTVLIGLLPTYETLGLTATGILVFIRLLQGLAVGGNYGGSFIFAVEHAPEGKKCMAGSWGEVGTLGGLLLGSLIGYLFSRYLSEDALRNWGWRLPFLMGVLTTSLAWYLRTHVKETPAFEAIDQEGSPHEVPLKAVWKSHKAKVIKGMSIVLFDAVGVYVLFGYLITYMQTQLMFSLKEALLVNTLSMLVMIPSILFFGYLSDRITPRRVLMATAIGFIVWPYPFFYMIQSGSWYLLLIGQVLCAFLMAACYGSLPAYIVELFPKQVRYSACGLTFNLSVALFGGTTPMFVVWLIDATGSSLAPAFYLILVGVLNFFVLATLPAE